jgi:signal transduction histidine kinase
VPDTEVQIEDANPAMARPGWLVSRLGALLERSGLLITTIAFSIPVTIGVMIMVEVLYYTYDVNRARIPWFGFAYLPVSLMFTPACTFFMLKVIDREVKLRHELRTPLNAILGYSEVIRDQALGEDKQDTYRKYADDIHRSGQHLLSLINDLLDVSKIEAGRITLTDESVKVSDLIESCLTLVGPGLKEKGVNVSNHLEKSKLTIQVDRRAASQVIVNILSNAARHNGSCNLTLSGLQAGDWIELEIADNGIGIAANKLESIFEPFSSGASIRTEGAGVGLGLPISKRLMTALGGDLILISTPGAGTKVRLIFRKA